jgi:hypothetical protein
MSDCLIKSGEIVGLDDARLNDTECVIEPGAIIRPPVDAIEEVVKEDSLKKEQELPVAANDNLKTAPSFKKIVVAPLPVAQTKIVIEEKEEIVKEDLSQNEEKRSTTTAAPSEAQENNVSPAEVTDVAITLGVAAVGVAAASSISAGFSSIQAKISSLLGTKAAAAAAVTVTAGTIVAVKALESKMGNLEKDMEKAKEEVGGAASSIDRIDELLSRLGSNGNDKLNPPV